MTRGNSPSDRFVADLSVRPLLKLWAHPNPKGTNNEDICDCLVVCGPHIVIISVKNNDHEDNGDPSRWQKAAIEESAASIRVAERLLDDRDEILRHDGRKMALPKRGTRQYHRISVLPGRKGRIPMQWGDTKNGFVHIGDRYSIGVVFTLLDTITDLLEFLQASEALIKGDARLNLAGGGIEDLAALYISRGNSFNQKPGSSGQPDSRISLDGFWRRFSNSADYIDTQNELKISYGWDRFIDSYADYLRTDKMPDMHGRKVNKYELALITMALQPRRDRAVLAEAFNELLGNRELKSAARPVRGYADTAFVFLIGKGSDRKYRSRELSLRCLVIRGRVPGVKTVVGISIDRLGTLRIGRSSAISYLYIPEWTPEYEERVVGIQADLGYFNNINLGL